MQTKKTIIFLALVFFGLFGLAEVSEAKNLYVNNSGSPACSDATTYANNSASNPWCGLLRAVRGNSDGNRNTAGVPAQAAQAGDTVYVTAGIYNYSGPSFRYSSWLDGFYDPINSGTSNAWITFQAVGTVELRGNINGQSNFIGSNSGKEYYKFIGFTVNEANIGSMQGIFVATSSHVRFENNTIIGTYRALGGDNHPGIMIHGPRSVGCTGVISDIHIKNNTISGFTGDSGRNDAGITLYCADNILIENNEFYGNSSGIYSKNSYTPSAISPAVTIRYNIFRDNLLDGIESQSWSNWHIYQNLFLRNRETAISLFNFPYYVGGAQPRNYRIVNNTFYGNANAFRLEGTCGDAIGMDIKNNIAYGTTGMTFWGESASCSTNITKSNYDFNYNMYGHGGNFANLYYLRFPLSTWQSTTYENQDTNSTSGVNPIFVDAAGSNFRLQGGSPAINAGIDILDLDGDSSTVDAITLGAYITGNETIGLTSSGSGDTTPPAAPQGLSVS